MKPQRALFPSFARVWTPVELSRRVRRAPRGLVLAGAPIVLFRDADNRAAALLDRCPHRGVQLSRGKRTRAGRLQCPFHGWEFDAAGACMHVPFAGLDAARRAHLGATALPVHEAGGLIWVYTQPGLEADAPPHVPDALAIDKAVRWYYVAQWSTHWTRAMENMLDVPHLPFVHRTTIGRSLRRLMRPDSIMDITVEDRPYGFHSTWRVDGRVPEEGIWLDWVRPNNMTLNLSAPGALLRLHVWCVPVDDTHVRMIACMVRTFQRANPLLRLLDEYGRYIVYQDKRVLEGSQPAEVPHPSLEHSVATDRATQRFRTWYLHHLRDAPATAAPDADAPADVPAVATPGDPATA